MNEEKTQIADVVALDCCFNKIIATLKKYHETGCIDIPLCVSQGFIDFVETDEVLAMGGFMDNKTYCQVTLNRAAGTFRKYHNGIEALQ